MPREQAAALLAAECRDDPALLREVASLLAMDVSGFLEQSVMERLAADPRAFGHYEVIEPIGSGGYGSVYRCRDVRSGAVVALKTVRDARGPELGSIRREIQTLAGMRHPGIVAIAGHGVQRGIPWYAMELVEGESLASLLASSGDALSTLPGAPGAGPSGGATGTPWGALPDADRRKLLTIARGICEALAYLHGEGIVHRDLKPANVMVRTSGVPVLVDFGVAASFAAGASRERMSVEGMVVGTVLTMAPEQVRGELVDARADLYSLGCILHEMIAGRPPFLSAEPSEVLRMHLEAPPPQLAAVPGVPAGLAALVARLLAKDPRDRIGYATDVAAALAPLGAGEVPPGAAPRSYLYRSRLAGRDELLAALLRGLDDAAKGRGGVTLLSGVSGAGKTRVALELSRIATGRGARVLTGECLSLAQGEGDPGSAHAAGLAAAPLQGLLAPMDDVVDHCRAHGAEESRAVFGERARILETFVPGVARLEGLVLDAPLPPELPAEEARQRLYGSLWESLRAFSRRAAVLLILDDLHAADALTIGFLRHVAQVTRRPGEPGEARVMIVGISRAGEEPPPLLELLASGGLACHELGRLRADAVGTMVGDMLAHVTPDPRLVELVARESEGNPFFVAEYLRTAVFEDLLARGSDGRWRVHEGLRADRALALPASIAALVARRLEKLGETARRLLDAASVVGRRLDAALLADLAGLPEEAADAATGELLARHILEESPVGELRFSHDKVREVAYGGVAEPSRSTLHRAAAGLVEGREPPGVIAHHLERGGEPERARALYLAGARESLRRLASAEAEKLYASYLRLAGAPCAERVAARIELGYEAMNVTGRRDAAREVVAIAVAEAAQLGLDAEWRRASRALAYLEHVTGASAAALERCRGVVASSRDAGDAFNERMAVEQLGLLQQELGHPEESLEHYERALALHRAAGDGKHAATALANLATVHHRKRRVELARRLYAEAVEAFREAGQPRLELPTLGNLAALELEQGRLADAEVLSRRALALSRQVGFRPGELQALGSLAFCRAQQGDAVEARALHEETLRLAREVGDLWGEQSRLGLAELDVADGELERARDACEEILRMPRLAELGPLEGGARMLLACLLRLQGGSLDEAEALAAAAAARFHELEDPLEAARCRCELGHVALARGLDASPILDEVARVLDELGSGGESDLARRVAALRGAQAARDAGRPLVRGALLEELPPALARRLT